MYGIHMPASSMWPQPPVSPCVVDPTYIPNSHAHQAVAIHVPWSQSSCSGVLWSRYRSSHLCNQHVSCTTQTLKAPRQVHHFVPVCARLLLSENCSQAVSVPWRHCRGFMVWGVIKLSQIAQNLVLRVSAFFQAYLSLLLEFRGRFTPLFLPPAWLGRTYDAGSLGCCTDAIHPRGQPYDTRLRLSSLSLECLWHSLVPTTGSFSVKEGGGRAFSAPGILII